jgi:hypothetical protein
VVLVATGMWLWKQHASAWDLGSRSPVLSYDPAEYALAARELAEHGRLATTFALPLELARHPDPPWPLALVQPGPVVVEAALFKLAGPNGREGIERREWLVLALPVASYLLIGVVLALGCASLLACHAPGISPLGRGAAGLVVGLAFLLDPEAQHFAVGGFTELPFTLGLIGALLMIGLEVASRRPFAFGLLLGVTGAFRGNMLWLAPILAAAAAWPQPPERRLSTFGRVLLGYAVPLAPWWFYKWRAFGSPAWDLSWLALWDGVGGRTWFSLNHLPELPELPRGADAVRAIAAKVGRNLPALLSSIARGPNALWVGSFALWLGAFRPRRAVAAAGIATMGVLLLSVLVAAASVPISRYVFPVRITAQACGILALWAMIARAPATLLGTPGKLVARVLVAALALGWGGWETARRWAELRAVSFERGVPSASAMADLVARLDRDLTPGEPVMSNLGPVLAWHARRPVVHLALSPSDVDACRQRLDVRYLLLVFNDPSRAWPEWRPVVERPDEATQNREWNVARAERFGTRDGFVAIWLELGALRARLAEGLTRQHADAGRARSALPTRR